MPWLKQVIVAPSKSLVTFSTVRFEAAGKLNAVKSLLNMNVEVDTVMEVVALPSWVTDHILGCRTSDPPRFAYPTQLMVGPGSFRS